MKEKYMVRSKLGINEVKFVCSLSDKILAILL